MDLNVKFLSNTKDGFCLKYNQLKRIYYLPIVHILIFLCAVFTATEFNELLLEALIYTLYKASSKKKFLIF